MAKTMKTMDGNTAASYVAYAFTDVAAIYPITPSSSMAENVDEWSAHGQKNLFGQEVKVVEMQSEAGAAGAVHGSLATGALTTTFTASQGLLLMIPNMYKIAGELLPGVFHVSARAVAGHALSIFGDHSDVMAARQTGFAMIASGSIQEIMDLSGVAHLASIKSRIPFLHFFDGFRSSSEVQKIETIDYKDFDRLLDKKALKAFRDNGLNPEHPVTRGTAQNPDIFFQAKEASNPFYLKVPGIVEDYMKEISTLTGRPYNLFDYYGAPDADKVIIAMGSITETAEETIDYLNANGEKTGLVKVRLYRPFSVEHFLKAMPSTVKKIAVLDRTKEPGSVGEPLYMDICNAYFENNERPLIIGGRYGLGSKDTTPGQIKAVFDNLSSEAPKNHFTIGIVDDVTNTSIETAEIEDTTPESTKQCKFWGLGADGTVGANKAAVKIIGDNTDMYAQAYFSYDSKKSGGITVSHLRFGKKPIKSTYLISNADYVACHNPSYVDKYDMVSDVKPGGTFLLNCGWSVDEMEEKLPAGMKKYLADNNINFYTLDGIQIAKDIGLGGRINMVMQAAFFKLADIIPLDDAVKYLKEAIKKAYGSKGEKIVEMNNKAVDLGIESLIKVEIPESWKNPESDKETENTDPDFIKNIMTPINAQKGDTLPVSAFKGIEDGTFPNGTTAYEKRGIAVDVPEWQFDKCIQCNQCAYVCPHAVIRPFLVDEKEAEAAPSGFDVKKATGKNMDGLSYRIQISPLDCTGCGSCANTCPAKEKALIMKPLETQTHQTELWDYAISLPEKENPGNINTVKFSQFEKPLLEFSGACAGCGETPYAKLITQMFGDRMLIANATGCSSIWGGSAPATPYTVNSKGYGPAWANSLFEDNAEYGLGMHLGIQQVRGNILNSCLALQDMKVTDELKEKAKAWIDNKEEAAGSKKASVELLQAIENENTSDADAKEILKDIKDKKDFLIKKSQWVFGGDGWAYDIGYGGLDHVLASGEDVNIMVFDTEVYSNTGGQASKATPTGSVAKFAASGKPIRKKDLGLMAMSYGYVYVAQISMGASQAQCIKAIAEAENYKGPSLIIAYAPCINHGIKGGLGFSQMEEKKAVESGYWHLYRYNPDLKEENKNPFSLDSKDPSTPYQDFIREETRYSSLTRTFPEIAEKLFKIAEDESKERLQNYKRLADKE
jgi:pyruvate-ferredoxin/flavodoxin oxidoreductase